MRCVKKDRTLTMIFVTDYVGFIMGTPDVSRLERHQLIKDISSPAGYLFYVCVKSFST